MAPTVESDKNMKSLLMVMKHSELPKPNYTALAQDADINTPANAQRRFKALVEKAGFLLVNDQVVPADGSVVTPKKAKAKKGDTPASKKRKMGDAEGDGAGGKDAGGSAGGEV